jgi:AcrR family transcriptional regulator
MASRTRVEQAADTRRRIIDAAAQLAASSGDEAVRILDVASTAQVSTGALYHHFANREDLLAAVHLERYRGSMPADLAFMDSLVDIAADARALRAGLLELTRVVNRSDRSVVRRNRAATIGLSLHQPAVAAALAVEQRHTTETMAAALGRAQARGFLHPSVDPTAAALMFQAIALGLVLADVDPHGAPAADAWEHLVGRLLDSVLVYD